MSTHEAVIDLIKTKSEPRGFSGVPVSGTILTDEDKAAVIECALDGWITDGPRSEDFRTRLKRATRSGFAVLCNSGSSANLLAVSAMRRKYGLSGGKVITCATGFPTTVAPIVQNGFTPVFVDMDPRTLSPDLKATLEVLERDSNIVGVIFAHTLGFPFDARIIAERCARRGAFFVEDTCDALGAQLFGQPVGTYGDCSTYSFFPAHHITTGEGGAVCTSDAETFRITRSLNNWGRDCWCEPGKDDSCGNRFGHQFGSLPDGYDHKYVFTELGYNLKMTDLQAALGVAQMERLDTIVEKRRSNYMYLLNALAPFKGRLEFVTPIDGAEISPFGFPIVVVSGTEGHARSPAVELSTFLETRGVRTRPVFAGNLVRQPMMEKAPYEVHGSLSGADRLMTSSFWVGCWPGLERGHLDLVAASIGEYFGTR